MRWILRLALVAAAGAIGAATVARADDSASVHGKATAPGLTKERVDASPDKAEDNGDESDQPAAGESPDQAPPAPSEEPQLGQKLGVTPSEGTVRVRQPDEGWAELDAGTAVPNGSVVRITLRASPKLDLRLIQGRVTASVLAALREQMQKDFEREFDKILPHSAAGAFA